MECIPVSNLDNQAVQELLSKVQVPSGISTDGTLYLTVEHYCEILPEHVIEEPVVIASHPGVMFLGDTPVDVRLMYLPGGSYQVIVSAGTIVEPSSCLSYPEARALYDSFPEHEKESAEAFPPRHTEVRLTVRGVLSKDVRASAPSRNPNLYLRAGTPVEPLAIPEHVIEEYQAVLQRLAVEAGANLEADGTYELPACHYRHS